MTDLLLRIDGKFTASIPLLIKSSLMKCVLAFVLRRSLRAVSEIRTVQKLYRILTLSESRTTETWILDDFLQKLKIQSVTCYTDRLLANQIARKLIRISCHLINHYIRYCLTSTSAEVHGYFLSVRHRFEYTRKSAGEDSLITG